MLKSMTAYGRCRRTVGGRDITVELKSVNNRYFDCAVRIPRAFGYLEEKIKAYLQSRGISRGKLDVSISIEVIDSPDVCVSVDSAYAAGYIAALRRLCDENRLRDDISVMTVAQNRDIFKIVKPEDDAERDWELLLEVLAAAADGFSSARLAEGGRLEDDIREKLDTLDSYTAKISTLSEFEAVSYRARLEERLRSVLADNAITLDENRLLTECAIFADKIAVDEELVRLGSHFTAFGEALEADEPAGRRLDFLLQEINREINTVGSKCQSAEIARLVIESKCMLEKIREQIQNIE